MTGAPSLMLAFAAGLVSFVSPCCLPLVPGYLATVSGNAATRRQMLARSLAFVGTFSLIFVLLGLTATWLGSTLLDNRAVLDRVAGTAILVMGGLFIASAFVGRLNRQWRVPGLVERAGTGGPIVAGAAFSLAWTPCIGPTLGAILGLAATTSGTAEGGALLAVYAAGLAVPFIASALAFERAQRVFGVFRRHRAIVQGASGAMLVGMGILVLSGELFRLNVEAQRLLGELGLDIWRSV